MTKRRGERVLGPYADRDGWCVVRIDATGERSSSVFDTEVKALRYKELLEAWIERDDHTTETALAEYKRHLEAKGNKPGSVEQTMWSIGSFFTEPIVLSMLSSKRCEKLYEDLRTRPCKTGEPMKPDSHRGILLQVRSFLKWCQERGWVRQNYAATVQGVGKRRPRGKSLGKSGAELRIRDARAFYQCALALATDGDQGAVAVLTALLLGMRAFEIVSRRVRDLDED